MTTSKYVPFVVRPRSAIHSSRTRATRGILPWGVYERIPLRDGGLKEQLVSEWKTREDAREAARQLNKEEP